MGHKARTTRWQSGDFGAPAELPDAGALPTNKNVIAAVKYEITKSEAKSEEDKEVEALIKVKDSVLKKHKEVCPLVPIIEEHSVYVKVKRLFDTNKNAEQKKLKAKVFVTCKNNMDRLFDIIACKRNISPAFE